MVTDEPRDRTNAFASCPAATGEGDPPCPQFPDGAHRCGRDRSHVRDQEIQPVTERMAHHCTCGNVWTSLLGTLTDQLVIPKPDPHDAGRQMLNAINAFNRVGAVRELP